jgi:hypothetical protein
VSATIPRTAQFGAAYTAAFESYLADESERALHTAYELGREAVVRELSVLDLALVHHDAILGAILAAAERGRLEHVTRAAGDFFLESLSAFEMVKRGFREVQEAALLERRQTAIVRQLANLLADTSLAADAADALEEVLQLVAEQARELTGAECCVAAAVSQGGARSIEAASYPESEPDWAAFVESPELGALVRSAQLDDREVVRSAPDADRPWIAAALTALDGRHLGAIQLFRERAGDFTDVDEGVLRHLAQLTAAAVERAQLYRR